MFSRDGAHDLHLRTAPFARLRTAQLGPSTDRFQPLFADQEAARFIALVCGEGERHRYRSEPRHLPHLDQAGIPAANKIAVDVDHRRAFDLDVHVLPWHTRLATFIDQPIMIRGHEAVLLDLMLLHRCGRTHLGLAGAIHLIDDKTLGIDDDIEFRRFPAAVAEIDPPKKSDMAIDDDEFLVMRIFVAVDLIACRWLQDHMYGTGVAFRIQGVQSLGDHAVVGAGDAIDDRFVEQNANVDLFGADNVADDVVQAPRIVFDAPAC